jgi:hypothetical protein
MAQGIKKERCGWVGGRRVGEEEEEGGRGGGEEEKGGGVQFMIRIMVKE